MPPAEGRGSCISAPHTHNSAWPKVTSKNNSTFYHSKQTEPGKKKGYIDRNLIQVPKTGLVVLFHHFSGILLVRHLMEELLCKDPGWCLCRGLLFQIMQHSWVSGSPAPRGWEGSAQTHAPGCAGEQAELLREQSTLTDLEIATFMPR